MDQALDAARSETASSTTQKDRLTVGAREPYRTLSSLEVSPERTARPIPYRNDPFLPSLASQLHLITQQIQVIQIETGQLGETKPAGIEQLQHGEIAYSGELILTGSRFHRLEQRVSAGTIEIGRKLPPQLRSLGSSQQRAFKTMLSLQVAVEGTNRRKRSRDGSLCQAPPLQFSEKAPRAQPIYLFPPEARSVLFETV